jgi:hypothetical protein
MVLLYFRSPIRLHGVVLNSLSTGELYFFAFYLNILTTYKLSTILRSHVQTSLLEWRELLVCARMILQATWMSPTQVYRTGWCCHEALDSVWMLAVTPTSIPKCRSSWFSSVPPRKSLRVPRLSHNRFLPNDFQFIIHQWSYPSSLGHTI